MKSNTLLFECRFGHFPPDLFQVIHISSENDCLSGCYQYCIELIVPKHIHIDSFIQLPVQLCVYPESTTRPRLTKKVPLLIAQGQVTHYETRHHGNTNGYHVRIDVASWFSQLHKKAHSRVFVDKTPEEITTSIFKENNITPHQWRWHISSNHRSTTRLPLLLQLNEDDATFLQRLWATQDTAFVFEHTESKSILHIASTDKLASICTWQTSSNITYCPPKGMGRQTDVAVDWSYTLQSDNTPSLVLKTLRTDIQVGQAIRFTEPEHDWLSGEYWVIARHIQGNFSDQQSTLDYCCDLTLIPRNSRFSAPQLVTPVYPGLKTAYIDTASPHLDEMGAYIIRFPFDNRDISAGPGSNRVRFATPFGGEGYGWHFPLRPGTQVVVTLKNT
ncbi:MAG: type secretion system secreted protein VgrG, partial [Pseudomonadota bacterium]